MSDACRPRAPIYFGLLVSVLFLLLVLSGDIHSNPGPSSYPCAVCGASVTDEHEALECDNCHLWTHCFCCEVSTEEYRQLEHLSSFNWICPVCTLHELPFGECSSFDDTFESAIPSYPSSSNLRGIVQSSPLRLAVLNVRSLVPKAEEITTLFATQSIDILALTETWLDSNISDLEVCPRTYSIIRNDRNRRGGGVAFLVKKTLSFVPRPDFSFTPIESVWIEIFPGSARRSTLLCCTYKPPAAATTDYFDDLSTECASCFSGNSKIAIVGDFNCDTSNPSLSGTQILQNFCKQSNFTILPSGPTRVSHDSSSTLDLIITNDSSCPVSDVNVIPFSPSDHHLVSLYLHPRGKNSDDAVYIRSRNYKQLTTELIEKIMSSSADIWDTILSFESVSLCVECFNAFVTGLLDVICPSKWSRVSCKVPPWCCTPAIRNLRRLHDQAHKKAIRNGTIEQWTTYRKLRNLVTSRIRKAKANYLASLVTPSTADHKKFWKYFTHLKQSTIPDPIESTTITPNALNKYFCSIPIRIWDNLPESTTTPNAYLHTIEDCPTPFSLDPLKEEDIMSVISELDSSKAAGADNIPALYKEA